MRMRRFAAWMLAWMALVALPARQAGSEALEREQLIRGALLYKFAKFVEWPGAIGAAGAPLTLCILGDPDFAGLVARKVENLSVQGHPVAARSIVQPREARACHVAYYASSADLPAALAVLSLLDDYVAVSNTNVHLNDALGRRSRVLVTTPAEWRWCIEGERSPWLTHATLYRQALDGTWDRALARLEEDLPA